jgi:type II secretory pathway pseudopilin PulG
VIDHVRARHGIRRIVSEAKCSRTNCWRGHDRTSESGFTIIELLIVTTILPLIIGALSLGLITVFSLQSGVQNRLGDTADSQTVAATYQNDVQGASYITTQPSSNPQCGTGTQLLGAALGPTSNPFATLVSYDIVKISPTPTYALVRYYCTGGSTTPSSQLTISYNFPQSQSAPTVTCNDNTDTNNCDVGGAWIAAKYITNVSFTVTQTHKNSTSTYTYTLASVPQESATIVQGSAPINTGAVAGCGFANPGSGAYASTLCLVDFASLTGNNMIAARTVGSCLEMEVTLPGGNQMYFCINIAGAPVAPASLPTYPQAFLGNSCAGATSGCTNGVPFYTNIPGDPSLYQSCEGGNVESNDTCYVGNNPPNNGPGVTKVTISGIKVLDSKGQADSGWEVVGADAETTDGGESISWTSNATLNVLPNTPGVSDPVGNACMGDGYYAGSNGQTPLPNGVPTGLSGNGTNTVTCAGTVTVGNNSYSVTGALKTGTAMVWALTPTTFTTTLTGTGLEGLSFGVLLS